MAVSVLILGVSGSGKSASMRECDSKKFALVNVARKPLPFKGKFTDMYEGDDYGEIIDFMKKTDKKSIVIDDAQYLMGNEFMRRVTERGYDKFSEMAQNFFNLINFINQDLPQDKIVYLLGHTERDQDGNEKFKTMGKLIDQCINVEGMCTIVLKTHVADGKYSFLTQNSGNDTVKSPMGMFPSFAVDNNLNYVDEKIRNYYELGEFLSDEEMAEIDEAAKNVDVIKDEKPKRSRRNAKKEESSEAPKEEAREEAEEKPKRTRRNREEVKADNDKAVVESGLEEAGDNEEADFNEVENPPVEKLPRRRGRQAAENAMAEPEGETPEEAAPKRRRRRTAE